MHFRQPPATRQKKPKLVAVGVTAFALIWGFFEKVNSAFDFFEKWEKITGKYRILDLIPEWVPMVLPILLALIGATVVVKIYARYRLMSFAPLKHWERPANVFAGDPKLSFRYVEKPHDFVDLAKTENYGDWGETDVNLAIRWWEKYRQGQLLMLYEDVIIGGVDLWPVTKKAFDQLCKGSIGDKDIRPADLSIRSNHPKRYWYAGSISLSMVFRMGRNRRELLTRLIVHACEAWLSQQPGFPAQIIALVATSSGENLLAHHLKFKRIPFPDDARVADPKYVLTLHSRKHAHQLVQALKQKIA